MPPWLDWLDWLKWDCVGAGIVGRILGLWFRVCVSAIRSLFQFLHQRLRGLAHISNRDDFEAPNRDLTAEPSENSGRLPSRHCSLWWSGG